MMKPTDHLTRRNALKLLSAAAAAPALGWNPMSALAADGSATSELNALYSGLSLFWGDIHTHTGYSDGYGTPTLSFDEARRKKGLHFAAVTDHIEWIHYFEERLAMGDGSPVPLWRGTLAAADAHNLPGVFVTLPGFEWSNDVYGHRNVYFRSSENTPAVPPTSYTHKTPEELWAALEPYQAMTIPHHPTRWGHIMNWDHYNPATDRLVEIYSKWGNAASVWTPYELPTAYRRNPILRGVGEPGGVDVMMARAGYRIGVIAGTDCHQGVLGSTAVEKPRGIVLKRAQYPRTGEGLLDLLERGYTFDHREPSGGNGGLAAVWAPQLTREAIWDGLYQRHTYGTTGVRPIIRVAARDSADSATVGLLGDDVRMRGAPRLLVSAIPDAGSQITQIQLLNTNKVVATWNKPASGLALTFQDNSLQVGQTACYRCLVLFKQTPWYNNADNDLLLGYDKEKDRFSSTTKFQLSEQVWTSPIWVTRTA